MQKKSSLSEWFEKVSFGCHVYKCSGFQSKKEVWDFEKWQDLKDSYIVLKQIVDCAWIV